jgi:hypothetical protein
LTRGSVGIGESCSGCANRWRRGGVGQGI